jgi:hypothetical protein
MLDAWERVVIDEVIERVESGGGTGRTKLQRLFALVASIRGMLNVELAIRDWARRDKTVATRLRRIDNRRIEYMRPLFAEFCPDEAEVEVRCFLVLSVFVANHFIAAEHAGRNREQVVALAMRRLLD